MDEQILREPTMEELERLNVAAERASRLMEQAKEIGAATHLITIILLLTEIRDELRKLSGSVPPEVQS